MQLPYRYSSSSRNSSGIIVRRIQVHITYPSSNTGQIQLLLLELPVLVVVESRVLSRLDYGHIRQL